MCDFPLEVGAHLTARRPVLVDFAKSRTQAAVRYSLPSNVKPSASMASTKSAVSDFVLKGQTRSHCWLWLGHPLSSFLAQINYHRAVRLNPVIRHLLPLLDLRPPCPLCGPQFYAGQAATANVRP